MADNSTLPATGEIVRTIDKAGKKTQVVALDLGGAGTEALLDGALPVTGEFWPATQPVSGTVALDAPSLAALETISVANFPATQPVSGTVALDSASLAALETISVASLPALAAGTNNIGDVDVLTLPSLPADSNVIGKVTPSEQVGRTLFAINYNATNAAAADTLLTALVVNRAGVATTGQTSVAVTASKTLKLTGALVQLRTTTAALPWGVLTLRMNPSGAAVIGSPVVAQMAVSGNAAVAGNTGSLPVNFGDEGMEFSGAQQIGLSFANNVNTNVTSVTLFGYEYTTPS